MLLSHPGNNNSKVDSNPNSHKLLKPRKSNPLAGRGRNTGLIFSVVWMSPCPPSCPGSARAQGWSCGETFQPPAPAPPLSQNLAGEKECLCLSCCSSWAAAWGQHQKSIYHHLQEGKHQKEAQVVFRRINLCVCVCVLLCSL